MVVSRLPGWRAVVLAVSAWASVMGLVACRAVAQDATPAAKLGLNMNMPGAFTGYTLISPLRSTSTYLVDMEGRVVKQWNSRYAAGQDAYLLANGNLLRAAHLSDNEMIFAGASQGGRIQEFTWDGELVWDFKFHDDRYLRHHAITRMPNGNVMMIVWERKTAEECIAAGVNPEFSQGEILVDCLMEVQPQGRSGGRIVWEWHLWDHLVQDHDKTKANYGDVAAHAELVDANYARSNGGFFGNFAQAFARNDDQTKPDNKTDKKVAGNAEAKKADKPATDAAVKRLQGLGYVGTSRSRRGPVMPIPDWNHVNAVSYNAKLDQVMISPREFNEVWIIDHSTTTAEAASHAGGRSGRGGDLLYRWGNPEAYRAGSKADRQFFSQHDTHWIPEGLPGAGHLMVFNNGGGRDGAGYSSVDEMELPVDAHGNYARESGKPYGPAAPIWSYTAKNHSDFFAPLMSGAQRLPNGNTLICTGFSGELFEVTPAKELVWKLIVPEESANVGRDFRPPGFGPDGPPPGPPGQPGNPSPKAVELLAGPLRGMLQLEPEQNQKLDDLEADLDAKLTNLLTPMQREQLTKLRREQPPFTLPEKDKLAEIIPKEMREKLKLSAEQSETLAKLQVLLNEQAASVLKAEQKKQLSDMAKMAQSFADPGNGEGRRQRGGFPGPFGFGGVPGAACVFRAYRYGVDFPGLERRDMQPGKSLVDTVK